MRTLEGIDTLINFCCITPYLVAMLEDMRTLEGIDTGYILAPSPWWLTKLEDMRTLEGIDTFAYCSATLSSFVLEDMRTLEGIDTSWY